MYYDLKNDIDKQRAKDYLDRLIDQGAEVELTKKQKKRTYKQNRYLHLILTYFGLETGYNVDEVKIIFKKLNKDYFIYRRQLHDFEDQYFIRSTKDISKDDLKSCIDKFKNWSSSHGITLPDSDNYKFLRYIESREKEIYQYNY